MVFWPPPPSASLYLCCAEPCLHVSPGFEHLLLVWWGNGPCFLGDPGCMPACTPAKLGAIGPALGAEGAVRTVYVAVSSPVEHARNTSTVLWGYYVGRRVSTACFPLLTHCVLWASAAQLLPRCIEVARLPCAVLAPRWQEHYSLCGGAFWARHFFGCRLSTGAHGQHIRWHGQHIRCSRA